jgi:hypothetical protein
MSYRAFRVVALIAQLPLLLPLLAVAQPVTGPQASFERPRSHSAAFLHVWGLRYLSPWWAQ